MYLVDLDNAESDSLVKKDGKWYEIFEWGACELKPVITEEQVIESIQKIKEFANTPVCELGEDKPSSPTTNECEMEEEKQ